MAPQNQSDGGGSSDIDSAAWGDLPAQDEQEQEDAYGGGFGSTAGLGDARGDDEYDFVYRAVAGGDSREQVRRLIELCAQGSGERRKAAVDRAGPRREKYSRRSHSETPLQAAHRLARGDLVGLLIEAGAQASGIMGLTGGRAAALAACAAHGQVESVRALLRAGHDAKKKVALKAATTGGGTAGSTFATTVHLCLWTSSVEPNVVRPQLRALEALEVLVREGGAAVDARDSAGDTPIFRVTEMKDCHEAALDLLIRLGADVNAQAGKKGAPCDTLLLRLLSRPSYALPDLVLTACVRKLVAAGAHASGVFDASGASPLALAVRSEREDVVRFLLQEAKVPADEISPVTGGSALHLCVQPYYGYRRDVAGRICGLLLDAGADINLLDKKGRSLLLLSAHNGRFDVLQMLLGRGASADVTDESNGGTTPLIAACSQTHKTAVAQAAIEQLVQRSSFETRRATRRPDGASAIDALIIADKSSSPYYYHWQPPPPFALSDWHKRVIGKLLVAGAPVQPRHADLVRPVAESRGLPLVITQRP